MKILKIVLIIIFVTLSFWVYSWYKGRTAPAVSDTSITAEGEAVAYFAGGCFWCVEADMEKQAGVIEAISGYMGGTIDSPSYDQVASGATSHREIVQVRYYPDEISYRNLVLTLLKYSDPTDPGGSFFDRGHQYTSAIYYQTNEEQEIAEELMAELEARQVYNDPIVTSLELASTFWLAEEYHQDYAKKNPIRYNLYRQGSGRDDFVQSVWGDGQNEDLFNIEKEKMTSGNDYQKPSESVLRQLLTPLQYQVTQRQGTETPFQNEYWDNHQDGIYVDVISSEPLFSSTDKFDSGTGWPSFLKPLDYSFVTERQDYKLILPRTEIRSKQADSHLGHIIMDGPVANDKIRYCMNSAAMKFVAKDDLEAAGLGEYTELFN